MKTENAALRTLRVIEKIQKISYDSKCRNAWSEVLGVARGNESELLIKLGSFMSTPAEAVSIMNERFPPLKPQTDNWYLKFSNAMIKQDLNGLINTFQSQYTRDDNAFLIVMEQMISTSSFDEVDAEKIADAKSVLTNLLEEVIQSELEEKIKRYIVKSIRKIITALDDYQIDGSVPVLESIDSMMGHSFTDRNFRESLRSPIGSKIFEVVGAVADIMSIATGAPPVPWKQIGESLVAKLTGE